MNVVIQKGNLTRDVELKQVNSTSVVNFSMALNYQYTKKSGEKVKDTTFVEYELWGPGAEVLAKYVHKGDPLLIEGRLCQNTWETDGVKRSKHFVRVDKFELLSRSTNGSTSTPRDYSSVEDNVADTSSNETAEAMAEDIPF